MERKVLLMDPSKELDELFQKMQHTDRSNESRRSSWMNIQNQLNRKNRQMAPIFTSVAIIIVAFFLVFTFIYQNPNIINQIAKVNVPKATEQAVVPVKKDLFPEETEPPPTDTGGVPLEEDKDEVIDNTEVEEEHSEEVEETEEAEKTEEPKSAVTLETLPNAEAEAAKWNEAGRDFIAQYNEYKMDSTNIKKDTVNSNDEVSTFFHDFKTSLKIRIVYTVKNETNEIIEMKLVGHELPNADRNGIFHAMSIFISYVDGEVSQSQAGGYLEEIPFGTNEAGSYKNEFNGKKYEYILNFNDFTNILVYKP